MATKDGDNLVRLWNQKRREILENTPKAKFARLIISSNELGVILTANCQN